MDLHIMVWSGESVLGDSIFGVEDKAKPGKLPRLSDEGGWKRYRPTIPENRSKLAAEAKTSIAQRGYYLIGGKDNVAEIEKPPPDEDENALPPWATPDEP